jgi:hypothetical protein
MAITQPGSQHSSIKNWGSPTCHLKLWCLAGVPSLCGRQTLGIWFVSLSVPCPFPSQDIDMDSATYYVTVFAPWPFHPTQWEGLMLNVRPVCVTGHDTFIRCTLLYKHIFDFIILSPPWQATLVKWFITINARPCWCHCFQYYPSAAWRSGMSFGPGTALPLFLTMTATHCYSLQLTPCDCVLHYCNAHLPLTHLFAA